MAANLVFGGIVLCGGHSSRMGQPKAFLPFGNELMLQRVVRTLSEVLSPIVVVAAPGQDVPALAKQVVIARDSEEGRGPLQGIAAGLEALRDQADAAFVSSCDVPFLRPAFVKRMIELLGDHAICVPQILDRCHPLAAVYRIDVLPVVEQLLKQNRLRTADLFEMRPTRFATPADLAAEDPTFQSLRNLNTQEDYAQALHGLNE